MIRSRLTFVVYADDQFEALENILILISKYLGSPVPGVGDLVDIELEVSDSDLDNGKDYKVVAYVKVK